MSKKRQTSWARVLVAEWEHAGATYRMVFDELSGMLVQGPGGDMCPAADFLEAHPHMIDRVSAHLTEVDRTFDQRFPPPKQ